MFTSTDGCFIGWLFHRGLAKHQESDTGYHDGKNKTTQYALIGADTIGETEEEQECIFELSIDINAWKCKVNQRKNQEEEARYTATYQCFHQAAHFVVSTADEKTDACKCKFYHTVPSDFVKTHSEGGVVAVLCHAVQLLEE